MENDKYTVKDEDKEDKIKDMIKDKNKDKIEEEAAKETDTAVEEVVASHKSGKKAKVKGGHLRDMLNYSDRF